jgi:hypothetical protein
LSFSNAFYYGKWDGSGQIPLREVSAGLLERFGSEDSTEGGNTTRDNLNLVYTYTPTARDTVTLQLYGTRYKLDLFTDFTFYKDTGLRFIREPNGLSLRWNRRCRPAQRPAYSTPTRGPWTIRSGSAWGLKMSATCRCRCSTPTP